MTEGRAWRFFLRGMLDTLGAPGLVLAASYVGFGSLVRTHGLTLTQGMFSTLTAWALPGQVALIEMWTAGAGWLAVGVAVWLTNLRLMPMVMSLMPHLRRPGTARWKPFAVAHLVAVTSWVIGMREAPAMPPERRLAWFSGLAVGLWLASFAGTAAGFLLAGTVPPAVALALVFVNPMYFVLILLPRDLGDRSQVVALVLGAVLGPLFHLLDRDWGLLLTGLTAGTAAFLVGRRKGWGRRV